MNHVSPLRIANRSTNTAASRTPPRRSTSAYQCMYTFPSLVGHMIPRDLSSDWQFLFNPFNIPEIQTLAPIIFLTKFEQNIV
jgi:hypothetical protein